MAGVAIVVLSIAVVALRPKIGAGVTTVPQVSGSAIPAFKEGGGNLLANPSFEVESSIVGVAETWVRTDELSDYAIDSRAKYGLRSQRITKSGAADPINA